MHNYFRDSEIKINVTNIDKLMTPVFRFGSVARNKKDFSGSSSALA
ncbi:hypothetical protein H6B10_01475 [Gemmiger formicilis]|nr:hypothetical protein [Gemmiger formicilis]MBM6898386.1 hypothetical protein [Gemmiger formicilis]